MKLIVQGGPATVEIRIYSAVKYDAAAEEVARHTYNCDHWCVRSCSPEEIKAMGFDDTDPHDEYLVLDPGTDHECTFRNSYCDMFGAR